MKPKARKFRIRRSAPLAMSGGGAPAAAILTDAGPAGAGPTGANLPGGKITGAAGPGAAPRSPSIGQIDGPVTVAAEQTIDDIRQEGLTGRELRMARRVAQKHGLAVTSDFDAVLQLRAKGIDPFQRSNILELVVPGQAGPGAGPGQAGPGQAGPGAGQAGRAAPDALPPGRIQLPQTVPQGPRNLPSTERATPDDRRASEIIRIQRDIARRRRRKVALLFGRLGVFVLLPTLLVGWYFYMLATPMYATKSEFIIQQAQPASGPGLGGLFQGTSMATQQDSISVQSYLTSRAAFVRLDAEHGFKAHFADAAIDPIQRLADDATNEAAYDLYQRHVIISYDPTEGVLRMEVIAADPATSQQFSDALIAYAEEQVDQLTQRLREDQMSGARASYVGAEQRRSEALAALLAIQQDAQQIDPVGETAARTAQISALEQQRQQLQLNLQERLGVSRPNEAQVNALRAQISSIETLIGDLRAEMTNSSGDTTSLAAKNTELRLAEENYAFQTLLVQQALQQMEAAQIEANRQVRYLSKSVEPVAPDEPTYPRAFENTALAFLSFAGIYLMLSLTASILREQVTS